jgi:hypothetical protein
MFGPEHYVPVLRWKRGEQKALALLEAPEKNALTPLIEIPPDDLLSSDPGTPASIEERFPRLTAALELAIGNRSVFVDFGLLDHSVLSLGTQPIQRFFGLLGGGGVAAVPVVQLGKPEAYQAAIRTVSRYTGEVALRVARSDLSRPTIQDEITALLASHDITYEDVHLIVDVGTDDAWLVMRGEALRSKTGPKYAQYPATAELLCEQKEYRGPAFSSGDHYIWQIASREIEVTGSPETWLRAGINHHLAFVVRQVAAAMPSPLAPWEEVLPPREASLLSWPHRDRAYH